MMLTLRKLIWVLIGLSLVAQIFASDQVAAKLVFTGKLLLLLKALDWLLQVLWFAMRTVTKQESPTLKSFAAIFFSEKVMGLIRLEARMWQTLFSLLGNRKKLPLFDQGYELHQGHKYDLLFYVMIFSAVVELPFFHLMIFLASPNRQIQIMLHAGVVVATVYAIIWLLMDRFSIRRSRHFFSNRALELNCGFRAKATISLESIRDVESIKLLSWKDLKNELLQSTKLFVMSPMDVPNVLLKIDKKGFSGNKNGLDVAAGSMPSAVALYVDRPMEFIENLRARMVWHIAHERLP